MVSCPLQIHEQEGVPVSVKSSLPNVTVRTPAQTSAATVTPVAPIVVHTEPMRYSFGPAWESSGEDQNKPAGEGHYVVYQHR